MKSAIDHAAAVSAGHIDEATRAWLQIAFSQWLAGEKLENALRLDRAARLRERNQALLDAAALVDTGAGPWHTAGKLAQAIRFHRERVAHRIRRDPATELGELDKKIHRALAIGGRCPTSQRRLHDLIR